LVERLLGKPAKQTAEQQRTSAGLTKLDAFIRGLVTERLRKESIPGRRFRNVHAALVVRKLVTRRFAFPCWVLAYRYRSELYRVVISGHNADCLVGSAPYSAAKIVGVVCGGALVLALVSWLVLAL